MADHNEGDAKGYAVVAPAHARGRVVSQILPVARLYMIFSILKIHRAGKLVYIRVLSLRQLLDFPVHPKPKRSFTVMRRTFGLC